MARRKRPPAGTYWKQRKAPHNGTSTSKAAAASIDHVLTEAEQEVYDLFSAHPAGLTTEQAEKLLVPKVGSKKHQSVSARVSEMARSGLLIKSGEKRKNDSGRYAFVYVISKEISMAAKKKDKPSEEDLVRRIIRKFMDQLGEGKSPEGFTYDDMRAALELEASNEEFLEVSNVMSHLREEAVLSHRFSVNGKPSEIDFQDDSTDIPNIQKRKNTKGVKQLVFFLSQYAKATIDGEEDPIAVLVAVAEGERELSEIEENPSAPSLTRKDIATFIDGLADVIDTYAPEKNQEAMIYLQVLKPVVEE